MIRKINKIKNLGIFSDYQWYAETMFDFDRYNLFYGLNGSGKTTLTKLFSILEKGSFPEFPLLEYEIEFDKRKLKSGSKFNKKIRVFNQDYISNNIEILGHKAKPIFILGEENKKLVAKIMVDEKLLSDLEVKSNEIVDLVKKIAEERGKRFTDVAKIIGANTSGSSIRNYRKPDAETAFALISKKSLLTKQEITKNLTVLKQEENTKINELTTGSCLEDLKDVVKECEKLCLKTVQSLIIKRFEKNPDISSWVELGLSLHLKHNSKSCEFCDQNLPEKRIKSLNNCFNREDKELKSLLDDQISKLNAIYVNLNAVNAVDKANFYKELLTEYVSKLTTFNKEKVNLLTTISGLTKLLNDKKNQTRKKLAIKIDINDKFEKSVKEINRITKTHNDKSANFQAQRDAAQKELENHYWSEIYDDVKKLDKDIIVCNSTISKLDGGEGKSLGILKLRKLIAENKALISSEHKACKLLNETLETFIGRKEIVFEVDSQGGYLIKRNGVLADSLSEGEKTAIAFVYFIVHLKDRDFSLSDGVIVIDDPVSSLDSSSLFQAFSFLKNSVENAGQVFIFTHNFDFLRLLLNWLNFKYVRNHPNKPYYMVDNILVNNNRVAVINRLDPLLINHESEYHYLCKMLFTLEANPTMAEVYPIPNIARKVLETFLMFRVPNGDSIHGKLEKLKFDKNKKDAIYKFINVESHLTGKGFDPSLMPETQKNVKYLLQMMKETFKEHYEILEGSI
ncbi:MAG: AAA family ATPase [Patescibacteria group bacterium]